MENIKMYVYEVIDLYLDISSFYADKKSAEKAIKIMKSHDIENYGEESKYMILERPVIIIE